jgi:GT2 family glycosyltransferase
MSPQRREKIVLLGMMSKFPVAGVVWQTLHYLIGFQRLGYDVYYVETHARTPSQLMTSSADDGAAKAAAYIANVMRRFDLEDRWSFVALHDDGQCYGLSKPQLEKLYRSAALVINLHGGTAPRPELAGLERLVYLETDPVQLQVELYHGLQESIDFLEPHCAFFTFAENYGNVDCKLPVTERFAFRPTRQPVVIDFWRRRDGESESFTTVAAWKQPWRDIRFRGELYSWSKHYEFLKFLDLPRRTMQPFELALSSCGEDDRRMLESKGWRVREALDLSNDPDAYRRYICGSRGEFSVAKDQNVRLRTGWFSDRSATYLAAGRPVITQETGFSNVLPTGAGLFGYSSMDEIVEAVESINAHHSRHRRAALAVAHEYFSHDVVLRRLLSELGMKAYGKRARREHREGGHFPPEMVLTPASRRPTRLPAATISTALSPSVPLFPQKRLDGKHASIVVVTFDNLVFTRLCLESILENTRPASYELIVVDNGSTDGTAGYLRELAEHHRHVRIVANRTNAGFPRACNQGLALATGQTLVLMNNDVLVPTGWLEGLVSKLGDPQVGLVGPVTNRAGNEAEIDGPYRTWQEFLAFAKQWAEERKDQTFDIRTPAMFCLAFRRDVYERLGPIDERFEVGLLEDDDYSVRAHAAGYRVLCADDVFVHHFGEASFGKLVSTGEYVRLLRANQKRFEEKWGASWQPYGRRPNPEYRRLTERIRKLVAENLPPRATVLVASRGDDELLKLDGHRAWHFPQAQDGSYAGHHPADGREAIAHLEASRARGGEFLLFPRTGLWWLDHYLDLREHLESRYPAIVREEDTCVIFALNRESKAKARSVREARCP